MNPPVATRVSPSGPLANPSVIAAADIIVGNLTNLSAGEAFQNALVEVNGDIVRAKGKLTVTASAAGAKSLRVQIPIGRNISNGQLVEANITSTDNATDAIHAAGSAAITSSNPSYIGALVNLGTLAAATTGDYTVNYDLTFLITT